MSRHNFDVAAVHGRFQPVHNGHLEYIMAAKRQSKFLYIGLTKGSISHLADVSASAHHRAARASNPLTFFERQELLRDALRDVGIGPEEFAIVPFPIELDGGRELPQYLPLDVPMLTTVYDDWNREKVRLLERTGYKVEVLWERAEKQVAGSQVRELIREGGDYEGLVPAATARAVTRLGLRERLRDLTDGQG